MPDDLPARQPGSGLPPAVRDAATLAGRGRGEADPAVLARVRDALARLPDSALGRRVEVPGDRLAGQPPPTLGSLSHALATRTRGRHLLALIRSKILRERH